MSGLGKTTRLAPTTCPYCGKELDAATAADDLEAEPQSGDVTVCIQCEAILIFDGDPLGVRKPTLAELQGVRDHLPLRVILAALAEVHGGTRQ